MDFKKKKKGHAYCVEWDFYAFSSKSGCKHRINNNNASLFNTPLCFIDKGQKVDPNESDNEC